MTPEGHANTLATNTLAPFMLTALVERPARLVYLSSGLHRGGEGSLGDLDWTKRAWDSSSAYAERKGFSLSLASQHPSNKQMIESRSVRNEGFFEFVGSIDSTGFVVGIALAVIGSLAPKTFFGFELEWAPATSTATIIVGVLFCDVFPSSMCVWRSDTVAVDKAVLASI
jgi:hypothetical protein